METKKNDIVSIANSAVNRGVKKAIYDNCDCEVKECAKKIVDAIDNVTETMKMEMVVSRKVTDTYTHATKVCVDSLEDYIVCLLQEVQRKDI